MSENKESKGIKRPFLVGFIVALVILNIVLIYLIAQNKSYSSSQDKMLKEQEQEYNQLQKSTTTRIDSMESALEEQIRQAKELGIDYEELLELKEQLEKDKVAIQQKATQDIAIYKEKYEEKLAAYEELLIRKDEELEKLRKDNDLLYEQNTTLKEQKNEMQDQINNINTQKEQLSKKVESASGLKATNITVNVLDTRGKEKTGGSYRSKQINQLKVYFTFLDNPLAEVGTRRLYLRVLEPSGAVLTTGSTFSFNGNTVNYTAMQQFLFDNSQQRLVFPFNQSVNYKKGKYTVEIYTDENLVGTGSFTVR